jgi:peptidoglycan/xylan/chitin deacetylase (PgdA/CDA1 family)
MSGSEQKLITLVFRYDDYSSGSRTDLEVKLIKAFQKYNIPCTFAVIPYNSDNKAEVPDPDPQKVFPLTLWKASILNNAIKAGILEVALHGYTHRTTRIRTPDPDYTEFAGLDYNSQIKKIAKGKGLLEKMLGVRITTFIPPWNTYDMNTIRALEELGFRTISADNAGVREESSQLKFLPFTSDLLNLKDAVESARKISDVQPVIVVLFHPSDFLEMGRKEGKLTYQGFVELLNWIVSQKDIHVRTIGENVDSCRFVNYYQLVFLLNRYLPFLFLLNLLNRYLLSLPKRLLKKLYSKLNKPSKMKLVCSVVKVGKKPH